MKISHINHLKVHLKNIRTEQQTKPKDRRSKHVKNTMRQAWKISLDFDSRKMQALMKSTDSPYHFFPFILWKYIIGYEVFSSSQPFSPVVFCQN